MATQTTTNELVITAEFADEDTRSITLPNPKATITAQEVQAAQTAAANVLIGDKAGASFSGFKSVTNREIIKTEYLY